MGMSVNPIYGYMEQNTIAHGYASMAEYHDERADQEEVCWTDKRLAKVTRLRLLSDPGFPVWDVSYCDGVLHDGSPCRVYLPFTQIPKRGFSKFLVNEGKRAGVFVKGLGMLDQYNISKLQ